MQYWSMVFFQDVKLYAEVASLDALTGIVEFALEEYNNTHKNRMDLVIFRLQFSFRACV